MLMSRRMSSTSLCSARRSSASRPSNAWTSGKPRSIISNIRCSSLESTTRTFLGFIAAAILASGKSPVKESGPAYLHLPRGQSLQRLGELGERVAVVLRAGNLLAPQEDFARLVGPIQRGEKHSQLQVCGKVVG